MVLIAFFLAATLLFQAPPPDVQKGTTVPEDLSSVVTEARRLKNEWRTDDAIALLSGVLAQEETGDIARNEAAYAELADCYYVSGDNEAAAFAYKTLNRECPGRTVYALRFMQCACRMKEYEIAIDAGRSSVQRDTIPAAAALIGDAFNQLEQKDSALFWYNIALRHKPMYPSVVSKAAKIYLDRKDFPEAIRVCDSLLVRMPDDITVAPIKGLALYLSGRYDDTIELFERQKKAGNDNYAVHYYLGQSYWQTKVLYHAESELLKAWQIDSSDVNLAYSIAAVKADGMRRFDSDVRPWLDKALSMLEPDPSLMSRIHQQYGHGEYRRDHWDQAIAHYKDAWRYNPKYFSALSIIGYCYERKGDWRSALEWYEKYLSLAPKGTTAYEFVSKSVDIARAELHMQ